jgi:transposase-like protein
MKKGIKIKPEEIIAILRQVEVMISQGKSVAIACRESAITEQTYYRWRKIYGGMQVSQAKEFKKLQEENARLKRAVADLTLDKLILNEALTGKY